MSTAALTEPSPAHSDRPGALLESELRQLCALVARGCTVKDAARYVGCRLSDLRRERESNEWFRRRLARAKLKASMAPLRAMQRFMLKNWRAAAWFLERTQPEKFARRNHRAFTQKQAHALIKDLTGIIGEEVQSELVSKRISERIEAAVRYATHANNDTQRTGPELRRAMRHQDMKTLRNCSTNSESPSLDPEPRTNYTATPQPKSAAHSNPPKPNHPRANSTQLTTPKPLASGASPNLPPQPPRPKKDASEHITNASPPGGTDCRPNVASNSNGPPRPIVGAAQP